jgi:hypothetical protein
MRRTTMVFVAAVTLVVGGLGGRPAAQETKSARGSVTALGADSITVKAGTQELVLAVDTKTVLTASGAGTADRRAEAAGKAGPRLSDFVKVGDAVVVQYQETGGRLRASGIQKVASAGGAGESGAEDRAMTSTGTVASVTGTTFSISGRSGGGGTFTQSFTVTRDTTVVAAGAGTASAKTGGMAFTAAVGVGDQVSVSYRKMGDALHAESVRVTAKKK